MATSENTVIYRIIVDSSKAVDGSAAATRALANLDKSAGSMDSTLARMERSLVSVGTMVKTHLALIIAEIAVRMAGMAKSALTAVAALDELAEQLGVTTEFLQASQFAAVQSGVKLEQLETAYSKFSQKMGEAADGSKDMVEALDRLGVKNLDVAGKLRPTEALMQDVATAILKIDEPARRAAAAVDFFGKTGTRMLPMLADIAAGADVMASKADDAGAMIEGGVVKALKHMADQSEVSALKFRALFATIGAPIITTALEAVNNALASILGNLDRIKRMEATKDSRAAQADAAGYDEQITAQRSLLAINPNNKMAQASLKALESRKAGAQAEVAARQEAEAIALLVSGTFKPTSPLAPDGASTSGIKGAGEDEAKKYEKLINQLKLAADAQDVMTAASRRGELAMDGTKVHLDAAQKALEIYGRVLDATDPKLQKIEELMLRVAQGKAAEAFNVATTELEKQNVVLAAEIRLMDASNEQRAVELALIKSTQEAQKAGKALSDDDIARRRSALETNEHLKSQAEELKRANELWTAPLKSALESIQRSTADMWEGILEGGKFSMESFGDLIRKTMRRAAAEILALATIRPVIGIALQAAGSLGLVGQGTISQMGYGGGSLFPNLGGGGAGSSSGGGGAGSSSGGGGFGGLGGLFSSGGAEGGGWLARQFGGVGDFLGRDVGSLFSSAAPAGGYADIGALISSGQTGASAAATGGISVGGALGSAFGFGLGAYNAITSKTTAGTLGGIGSMIGAGISLIPGLAPIGLGISLLSSILPGLFGGGEAPIPRQPDLNLGVGTFLPSGRGFASSGYGMNGGGSLSSTAEGLGTAVSRLFRSAGVSGVEGSQIGGRIWSGIDHTFNAQKRGWDDRPYTQVGLVTPGGDQEMVTYNDSSRNLQQAADLLIAAVFKANVLRGGVSGASDALKAGVTKYDPKTADETQKVVALASAYDKLGKVMSPVKDAIDGLAASFDDLRDFADKAGLSLDPINSEIAKKSKRIGQDFIDGMFDPLAVQLRALADQQEAGLKSAQYIKDHVEGVYVDMARIAEYYTRQEANLREQFYSSQLTSLKSLIARLTYGDLANASPATSLAGTGAAYRAALAQASAGDAKAIDNLSGYAENYISSARGNFASSAEYQAIVSEVRAALEQQMAALTGGTTGGSGTASTTNEATNAVLQSNAELRDMFSQAMAANLNLQNQVSALTEQVRRYATNPR